mmetsp:Transcript_21167/g.36072  ORF Transcript_21167/g.36072 Transcript_21167/m.36072 type:complete len:229 (+) Transcript_21167:1286-1972(+)
MLVCRLARVAFAVRVATDRPTARQRSHGVHTIASRDKVAQRAVRSEFTHDGERRHHHTHAVEQRDVRMTWQARSNRYFTHTRVQCRSTQLCDSITSHTNRFAIEKCCQQFHSRRALAQTSQDLESSKVDDVRVRQHVVVTTMSLFIHRQRIIIQQGCKFAVPCASQTTHNGTRRRIAIQRSSDITPIVRIAPQHKECEQRPTPIVDDVCDQVDARRHFVIRENVSNNE